MYKAEFERVMDIAGDACVHYLSTNSGKQKYVVCTLDLENDYIQAKLARANTLNVPDGYCLAFCWDTDSFKSLDPSKVVKILPLNALLNES
jgi:hypothetical protein